MIPLRLYLYGGVLIALALVGWGIHSAYTNWQDGVKQAAWQSGYDTAHAEVTKVLNEERAAVQAEREASERKARETEAEHRANMNQVAEQHEKDKADAERKADDRIAEYRAGTAKLRAHWEARAATATLVCGTTAAAAQPDGNDRLFEESLGRVLRAVGECQAQRDGLQAVIRADRGMQP